MAEGRGDEWVERQCRERGLVIEELSNVIRGTTVCLWIREAGCG